MRAAVPHCYLCSWEGSAWPMASMAQGEAVWHVYEEHRDQWVAHYGDRLPQDPDPRKSPELWAQLN